MNLHQYFCKKVKVIAVNNNTYVGTVDTYTPPQDNEIYEEAISLDCGWWFNESDIKSISVIESTKQE